MFWAFGHAHTQLRYFYSHSTFDSGHTWENIPDSPRLHNFNVQISEHGSLRMRLQGIYFLEGNSLQKQAGDLALVWYDPE